MSDIRAHTIREDQPAPEVSYAIKGYFLEFPLELQGRFIPYWSGFESLEDAKRYLDTIKSADSYIRYEYRFVEVTRRVVE